MSGSEILKLVQIELTRARNMAEHLAERADDGFLLYLIDMAILEVKRKARSGCAVAERSTAPSQYSEHSNGG